MSDVPLRPGDTMPAPVSPPGKTQPLPPEMPVPGVPSPEDVPPQPMHPSTPPSPTA